MAATISVLSQVTNCLIVAEVAQAHEGSLGMAHAFIDAAAKSGADAVKFQVHIAEAESTPDEPWRVNFSIQDRTRYDYWRRMEFNADQWVGLKQHAEEKGLLFLASPFSIEAANLLERIGTKIWKVASGEVTNTPLLDYMVRTGLPILLSTGMCTMEEIDRAVASVQKVHKNLIVMQCTTEYPCPPERVGLNLLKTFAERYGCETGLSDHSGTIFPSLAAITLGARVVEVHVTFSREMFGPDIKASITFEELAQLAQGARFIERALSSPVSKDEDARLTESVRVGFRKSIVARKNLTAGSVLTLDDMAFKKPGKGIAPNRYLELVGKVIKRDIAANELISESDIEW
jgi:N-acetylneuraminate synthase